MSRNCYCTREYNNTKYNIIISVRSHHSDLWKFGDILYISNQFGGLIYVMQRCILIACETKSPIKKNITFFKQSNCLLADHRAFIIFIHFGVVSSSCWILISELLSACTWWHSKLLHARQWSCGEGGSFFVYVMQHTLGHVPGWRLRTMKWSSSPGAGSMTTVTGE